MAEIAHLRLEHGLAELEEMERIGLFNRGEIRKIIKKRKHFEYRLRRKIKQKTDFLNYIVFEKGLLRLITKRRERLLCDSKKKEIDNSIAKKINRLYKAALSRYPEDKTLWLQQIDYCKEMKWNDSINALYTKLLQVHSKTPNLYVLAAQWEMENNHSYDNARKLLQRGVLMNPKSELLWREYFRMELKYVELIKKRREVLKLQNIKDDSEVNDKVLNGALVNVVYDNAIEELENVQFALSFIQICMEFDFASKNIDHILNDLQQRFPDKEETLDVLAKKPILNVQQKIEKAKKKGIKKNVVLREMYEEIYAKYDEAVKTLPTEKMWNFYLDFLFDILRSATENKKVKLQASVIAKMEKAAEANCLPLDYYNHWIEMLFNKGEEKQALSISLSAARKWNKVHLWVKCLTLHIQCQKHKAVYRLITEAFSNLKESETLPLWMLVMEWLSISDPERLIEYFESAIKKRKEVSLPLKEMYLQVVALRGGIEAARDQYNKFKKMGPLSLSIIRKIIQLEKVQLKPSLDLIRKYFTDAVSEFGETDIDIWLEYMHFEIEYAGAPMLCGMIHWQAMKKLKPDLIEDFETQITKYCTRNRLSSKWELVP